MIVLIIYRLMTGWVANTQFGRTCKKATVTRFEILTRHLRWGTENCYENPVRIVVLVAENLTGDLQNRKQDFHPLDSDIRHINSKVLYIACFFQVSFDKFVIADFVLLVRFPFVNRPVSIAWDISSILRLFVSYIKHNSKYAHLNCIWTLDLEASLNENSNFC
jgi:hypothetical protein